MNNYVAYDSHNGEMEMFPTLEDAKAFLTDQDWSDGIPEDFECGHCWIAKITHRTTVVQTDAKSNYDNPEDWPYSDEWDYVGDVELKEANNE